MSSKHQFSTFKLQRALLAAIIQPGGSIRDQEIIDCAQQHGLIMVFTGTRHSKY